jgi:predicted KAP-like P-loop ATPase
VRFSQQWIIIKETAVANPESDELTPPTAPTATKPDGWMDGWMDDYDYDYEILIVILNQAYYYSFFYTVEQNISSTYRSTTQANMGLLIKPQTPLRSHTQQAKDNNNIVK